MKCKKKNKAIAALLFGVIISLNATVYVCAETTTSLTPSPTQVSMSESTAPHVELWNRTTSLNDSPLFSTISIEDEITGEYSWGAKYIDGVTSKENSSNWDNSEVVKIQSWGDDLHGYNNISTVRIDAGNSEFKGKLWTMWKSVGSYEGERVNLKATIVDYAHSSYSGNVSDGVIMAFGEEIAFNMWGLDFMTIKYEYINAKTNEPISVKTFMTFDDIDFGQSSSINENEGKLYTPENSNLRVLEKDGLNVVVSHSSWQTPSSHLSEREDSYMSMFEGTTQTQTFYRGDYHLSNAHIERNETFLEDYEDLAIKGKVATQYFGYNGSGLSKMRVAEPTKVISDDDEMLESADRKSLNENTLNNVNEGFRYSVFHVVPSEEEVNWYKSYTLTDILADCVEFKEAKVYDEAGKDISELFICEQEGQKITFTAKDVATYDFYYREYRFDIDVCIKGEYDLMPWVVVDESIEKWIVKNVADVEVFRGGKTETAKSNEVKTIILGAEKESDNPEGKEPEDKKPEDEKPKDKEPENRKDDTHIYNNDADDKELDQQAKKTKRTTNTQNNATDVAISKSETPKTGDATQIVPYVLLIFLALVKIGLLTYKKKH